MGGKGRVAGEEPIASKERERLVYGDPSGRLVCWPVRRPDHLIAGSVENAEEYLRKIEEGTPTGTYRIEPSIALDSRETVQADLLSFLHGFHLPSKHVYHCFFLSHDKAFVEGNLYSYDLPLHNYSMF